MNVHQPQPVVQHGVEVVVPLNKLKKSPKNARKTPHAAVDVETLAASIAAKGVLQPPVIEREVDAAGAETGGYFVTIGEGRRLALRLLAKRKVIGKAEPIRCLLDETNDAFEVSLDENVTRFAMHPADQVEAFARLADEKGWSAEEIGARFGLSALVVRQRLRLATVSPVLMAAYRAEDLTLDQLAAFALSQDHARQEQVYAALAYNRSPSHIRRLLTEAEVAAEDRRARFIGAQAYEAAGGHIRRDLFAEDNGGWFEDVALLDRLVLERLTAEAERVRAGEGWAWGEAHIEHPQGHGMKREFPMRIELEPEAQAALEALAAEYDAIIEQCGDDPWPEAEEKRLAEIDAELRAAQAPVYAPEVRARAGVLVCLTFHGDLRVERGFVRAEDIPPWEDDGSETERQGSAGTPKVTKPKGLPDRLVADLTAHRTAALRDRLAQEPDAALLAAVHALVLQLFYGGAGESCLRLRGVSVELSAYAEGYDESVAARAILARHERWGAGLPEDADDLWTALAALSVDELRDLFAHCVSLTVQAVESAGVTRQSLAHADVLAAHLSLDMGAYWRATPASYFGRVSKPLILEAVREFAPERVAALSGLKKAAMAQAASDLPGADSWLPPLLKAAAADPA